MVTKNTRSQRTSACAIKTRHKNKTTINRGAISADYYSVCYDYANAEYCYMKTLRKYSGEIPSSSWHVGKAS